MNERHLAHWMEQALPDLLPGFLPQRRWFGGKARMIVRVDLEDAAWLTGGRRPYALLVVRVEDAIGDRTAYSLLLAFDDQTDGRAVVGRVDGGRDVAWAVEATDAPDAALALLQGFASSPRVATIPMLHGGTLLYRDGDEPAASVLAGRPTVQPVGADQSNTSLRLDRTLAFKLFRRLEHGENPELEIGRFLTTRTSFRALPILRGSLTYVPARGEPATLGVLQDWIENQGDGWSHVVGLLRQSGDGSDALRQDAFSLGTTTASFHQALAADGDEPAFSPEPVTPIDVDAWRGNVVERLSRTRDLVSRHMSSWPEPAVRLAESFVGDSSARVVSRLPDPETSGARFHKIRVHGDYHLGQTLRTAQGFVLIDFEGEPARPLAERRAKQAALKDVAGMLRSFEYAVEAARTETHVRTEDPPAAGHLRRAFLEGYWSACSGGAPGFLPADRQSVNAWIDFFELEKALYEVEYEVNNRPAWAHIPLRGLVRILSGRRSREEA
jgi:maltose alpha-D-glucosyltransferase/alpha-amylase